MTITEPQRIAIMQLWGRVCKERGWKTSDKMLRLAKFSELLGRPLASTNDVERLDECTKLMSGLKCLLGISVRAGLEATDPTLNQARVLRNTILTDLVPCLELYIADVAGFMAAIMEDKNRWWKIERPARGMTLMDLDAKPVIRTDRTTGELREFPSQLKQMLFTLSARLNEKRKSAGDSVHDMRTRAGLVCACARCQNPRSNLVVPAVSAVDPDLESSIQADPDLGAAVPVESECPY